MAKIDAWFPIYPGDYARDTFHLTTEEHGAYFLLLLALWSKGGSLSESLIFPITKLPPERFEAMRDTLAAFFQIKNGVWTQKRMKAEYLKSQGLREKRVAGAAQTNAKKRITETSLSDPLSDTPSGPQSGSQSGRPSPSPVVQDQNLKPTSSTPPIPSKSLSDPLSDKPQVPLLRGDTALTPLREETPELRRANRRKGGIQPKLKLNPKAPPSSQAKRLFALADTAARYYEQKFLDAKSHRSPALRSWEKKRLAKLIAEIAAGEDAWTGLIRTMIALDFFFDQNGDGRFILWPNLDMRTVGLFCQRAPSIARMDAYFAATTETAEAHFRKKGHLPAEDFSHA